MIVTGHVVEWCIECFRDTPVFQYEFNGVNMCFAEDPLFGRKIAV